MAGKIGKVLWEPQIGFKLVNNETCRTG